VELVIVRPPLVFSSSASGNLAALAKLIRLGVPLPLTTATDNRRSIIHRDNLADFLARCCVHPAAPGRTFLVSEREDVSTVDLLHRIGRNVGKPVRLFPAPRAIFPLTTRRRFFGNLQVDGSEAEAIMDWQPVATAPKGVRPSMVPPRRVCSEGWERRMVDQCPLDGNVPTEHLYHEESDMTQDGGSDASAAVWLDELRSKVPG
jgi:nucleoside-diphosphate-sugar epimerase